MVICKYYRQSIVNRESQIVGWENKILRPQINMELKVIAKDFLVTFFNCKTRNLWFNFKCGDRFFLNTGCKRLRMTGACSCIKTPWAIQARFRGVIAIAIININGILRCNCSTVFNTVVSNMLSMI